MMDFLKDKLLVDKQGNTHDGEDAITNKDIICYYFSASWCPPCRLFLPKLKLVYTEAQKTNIKLEIVYASLDFNEDDMMEHFTAAHGEWLALKFNDEMIEYIPILQKSALHKSVGVSAGMFRVQGILEHSEKGLQQKFGISGIPALVVVKNDGTVVTIEGRKEIEQAGTEVLSSWV